MAMGLPIITTNWSGTTEFINSENSYPLPLDPDTPLIHPQFGPFQSHLWANPSLSSLRHLMRHVTEHPMEAKEKGQRAFHDMRTIWAPETVANVLIDRLQELIQSPPTHPLTLEE